MTIHYKADEMNELSVLFKWRGTIMPMVLGRPVIWLLIALHCGLLYVHRRREDIELPKLPWPVVSVPQALLTFFVVFFSGSCYSRYYALYGKCTGWPEHSCAGWGCCEYSSMTRAPSSCGT